MHHATLAPVGARLVAAVAAAGALVATTITTVTAQDYPTRPIEIIVTWGPGGGADQTGRMIGKLLEPALKVSLPVENVVSHSANHAAAIVGQQFRHRRVEPQGDISIQHRPSQPRYTSTAAS